MRFKLLLTPEVPTGVTQVIKLSPDMLLEPSSAQNRPSVASNAVENCDGPGAKYFQQA